MKKYQVVIILVSLVVMAGVLLTVPQSGTLISRAYAKEVVHKNRIIADTLAAHKMVCLSRNGVIKTILLDGKWVDVQEVELINRTLILRTEVGNISLAAVFDTP